MPKPHCLKVTEPRLEPLSLPSFLLLQVSRPGFGEGRKRGVTLIPRLGMISGEVGGHPFFEVDLKILNE